MGGWRQLVSRLRAGRRSGNAARYERICAELAPACDSIERTDFLSGVDVEPFLNLADGAGRG